MVEKEWDVHPVYVRNGLSIRKILDIKLVSTQPKNVAGHKYRQAKTELKWMYIVCLFAYIYIHKFKEFSDKLKKIATFFL